jgi:perosamine synthetase
MTSKIEIPVAVPDLSGNEERYVVDAIKSSWISSSGVYLNRFEEEFAEKCQARYALGVCNGTVALHLAMLTLGIGPGDEVIVPSLTYIASANAVRYVGAEPVFVDVDPNTWCIDPQKIEASITKRTRAIMGVHIYGHPADMDAINNIAAIRGLMVIEDAAESFLARYKGRLVGSLSHIATFSFYGNKVITSGEGGAIVLQDDHLAQYAKVLRGQGMDPDRRYYFPITGYNFRMTNVAAALLCAQMERVEQFIEKRREIFNNYNNALLNIPGIKLQPVADWAEISPWLYCILIDPDEYGVSRDDLARNLAENGIETRPFFYPIHRLPPFRVESRNRNENLPVTDMLSEQGLSLPTFTSLSDNSILYISDMIRNARK